MNDALIDAIDALLPQTQCTRCGYPDCRHYASAIANGEAPINQCPPGGQTAISRLASLLDTEAIALNPDFGTEGPRTVAVIDEQRCIGCTLCIQACPVDAIVGSAKRMHTVLTGFCSGCDLCLAPCPVDCIDMVDLRALAASGNTPARSALERSPGEMAPLFRDRYVRHRGRVSRQRTEREQRLNKRGNATVRNDDQGASLAAAAKKRATIAAAMKRARARRGIGT